MSKETESFVTSNSKSQLFYRLFEPVDVPPKATLLILHGMQEHSGRYKEVARYFCERGFVVLTYDHLGHGKTAKNKEDHGFFGLDSPAQRLVDDAEFMANFLAGKHSKLPHYVLGHSMGSFVLRMLLKQSSNKFEKAVIVGTGGKNPVAGIALSYLTLMNKFAPRKRRLFLNNVFGKMNNTRFKNEEGADLTSWLSVSKDNRRAFVEDPLAGIPFTYNGFYTLLTLNVNATKKDWATPIAKDYPLLFVSGSEDPIGNFGKGVEKTVEDLRKAGFSDVSLKLYKDMRHEILNEDIKQQVFKEIKDWLESEV